MRKVGEKHLFVWPKAISRRFYRVLGFREGRLGHRYILMHIPRKTIPAVLDVALIKVVGGGRSMFAHNNLEAP